jgi:thiol-disulfide isomerase/thioredoxin
MTIAEEPLPQESASTVADGLSTPRKAAIGALLVVIIAAGTLLFTIDGGGADEPVALGELSEFHKIEVVSLDGELTPFAQFAGTPVVINFFASWCGPCKAEMPTIEGLHQTLGDELAVVGLAIEGERPARETVEETGVTYFIGLDEDGVLLERFDGFGMPTTLFVAANGDILDSHVGELTDEAFRSRIRDLFGVGDV